MEKSIRKTGLAKIIKQRIPQFILDEYPLLVEFLEAYYEWLDQQGNPMEFMQSGEKYFDVDSTSEKFLEHFKHTFLHQFPKNLKVHSGKTLDSRILIKNIREFYKLKGGEKSLQLLFKIITDSDIVVEYPREKMFYLSSAEYNDYRIMYLLKDYSHLSAGLNISTLRGSEIIQKEYITETGSRLGTGIIEDAYEVQKNGKEYFVLILSRVSGEFYESDTAPVYIIQNNTEFPCYLKSCVNSLGITNRGTGYLTGDLITIGEPGAEQIKGIVTLTNQKGGIQNVEIFSHPVDYSGSTSAQISTTSGTGGILFLKIYPYSEILPNYKSYKNTIGGNSRIQDSFYYQQYSYEIKSKRSLEEYIDAIKRIVHPSGFIIFNSLYNNTQIPIVSSYKTRAAVYEYASLGAYASYSPATINDLGNVYFAGYNPGNCFAHGNAFSYWSSGNSINPNTEQSGFTAKPDAVGYLNFGGTTLSYGPGQIGLQGEGLTYWRGFSHVNTRGMSAEAPAGICFANIEVGIMLKLLRREVNSGQWGDVVPKSLIRGEDLTKPETVKTPIGRDTINKFNLGKTKEQVVKDILNVASYEKYTESVSSGKIVSNKVDDVSVKDSLAL